MRATSHTPPPYTVGRNTSTSCCVFAPRGVADPGKVRTYGASEAMEAIAVCRGPDRVGNARLFAAAPAYAKAWSLVPVEIRERILAAVDQWVVDAIDEATPPEPSSEPDAPVTEGR